MKKLKLLVVGSALMFGSTPFLLGQSTLQKYTRSLKLPDIGAVAKGGVNYNFSFVGDNPNVVAIGNGTSTYYDLDTSGSVKKTLNMEGEFDYSKFVDVVKNDLGSNKQIHEFDYSTLSKDVGKNALKILTYKLKQN